MPKCAKLGEIYEHQNSLGKKYISNTQKELKESGKDLQNLREQTHLT